MLDSVAEDIIERGSLLNLSFEDTILELKILERRFMS